MIEVVLDTETTGLSTKDGHRIVEIGCIELENLVPTKKISLLYKSTKKSFRKSIRNSWVYGSIFIGQKFSEIVDEFLEFIKDKRLVIHNVNLICHI